MAILGSCWSAHSWGMSAIGTPQPWTAPRQSTPTPHSQGHISRAPRAHTSMILSIGKLLGAHPHLQQLSFSSNVRFVVGRGGVPIRR